VNVQVAHAPRSVLLKPKRLDKIRSMPTVLRQAGFDFMVYTHDHAPSHVHVWKAGNELIVNLGDEEHDPVIRENNGMSRKEAKQVWQIVEAQQNFLLAEWRRIHGQ
jgi:hypothetical protein